MTFFFLIYPLIGLIGGFLAGLLGIGGGLIIVPALMFVFPYQGIPAAVISHTAVATSLATVIVTSLAATYAHHRHSAVEWPIFRKMAPGLLAGACAGALIAVGLPGGIIRTFFGLFAMFVAIQMGFNLQPRPQRQLPSAPGLATIGAFIGMISAVVGVGGGTLTVPFLRWCNVLMQRAVATSSACGFPIAVGGSLGFTLMEMTAGQTTVVPAGIYWPAALWISAASVAAAPLGAKFTHGISTCLLTRVFSLVLAIVGLRLVWF